MLFSDNIVLKIFFVIINIIFFSLVVFYWSKKISHLPLKKYFWVGLFLKIGAGLVMGLLYKFYYPQNDSWHIFEVSKRLCEIALYDFEDYLHILLQNDPHNIDRKCHHYLFIMKDLNWRVFFLYKITHILHFLTYSNYWLINLYFSMFAYLGIWQTANTLAAKFGNKTAFAFAFLFLPSMVFWASGLSKESLFWGFMGIMISLLFKKINIYSIFVIFLCAVGLFFVKYYYLIMFWACYISYVFINFLAQRFKFSEGKKIVFFLCIVFIPILFSTQFYSIIRPEKILGTIVNNQKEIIKNSNTDNIIVFNLEATPTSFIKESPKALIGVLFRPFIWEKGNILKKASALENMVLFILLFFTPLTFYKKIKKYEFIIVLFYIVVLGVLLAFSAPNFGTLLRYRVGIIPFWAFLCSYFFFDSLKLSIKL